MNRFIVADSTRCIGCRTCEVACAVAHQGSVSANAFTPRIRVVKGGSYTTAVGCHQCEDAPCANVCPTQAIRRNAGVWHVPGPYRGEGERRLRAVPSPFGERGSVRGCLLITRPHYHRFIAIMLTHKAISFFQ